MKCASVPAVNSMMLDVMYIAEPLLLSKHSFPLTWTLYPTATTAPLPTLDWVPHFEQLYL